MTKKESWMWFNSIPEMWNNKKLRLLDFFGTPMELYQCKENALRKSGILSDADVDKVICWKKQYDVKKEENILWEKGIRLITIEDEEYPKKLKLIEDYPCALYVKGKVPGTKKTLGIVGARNCTDYGRQIAKKIGSEVSKAGIEVISGMARGIDTYGHLGALLGGGVTYAVLGCGVDVCYPVENIEMYERIIESGGIISEYPPGSKPDGWKFPQRNRIISALSDCVVVVEARRKSGSLITAEAALNYGKDVLVVPGRICDALSEGCNMLIKDGAGIICEVSDVLYYMGVHDCEKNEKINIVLEKDFEVVYSETDLAPVTIDELVQKTGMSAERVHAILLELQMKGLVDEPVKNNYIRRV